MVLSCGCIIVLYLMYLGLSLLGIGSCLGCIWFVIICLSPIHMLRTRTIDIYEY
jgi:hypothetical protein